MNHMVSIVQNTLEAHLEGDKMTLRQSLNDQLYSYMVRQTGLLEITEIIMASVYQSSISWVKATQRPKYMDQCGGLVTWSMNFSIIINLKQSFTLGDFWMLFLNILRHLRLTSLLIQWGSRIQDVLLRGVGPTPTHNTLLDQMGTSIL